MAYDTHASRQRTHFHLATTHRMESYPDGRLYVEVCHLPRPKTGLMNRRKDRSGLNQCQNGRVANELCHTKRMINAGELAQVT